MKPLQIEKLEWDSQFFGYPVAKVEIHDEHLCDTANLLSIIREKKYRLCYLFVKPVNKEINNFILENGGILVDQKTTLSKEAEKHQGFSNEIIEYLNDSVDNTLKRIAVSAGSFSRFKSDKNFTNNEFEKLYSEWILKSIKKEIALKTFIAQENHQITGLATLGEKDDYAKIDLIAVDENFHGRGIGSDLVRKADSEASALGFKYIRVVTQFQNKAALKLYEKCNFKIVDITNIYHLWDTNF